jgi:hypothetical protein
MGEGDGRRPGTGGGDQSVTNNDRTAFAQTMVAAYSFYRGELIKTAPASWWSAVKAYDLAAKALGIPACRALVSVYGWHLQVPTDAFREQRRRHRVMCALVREGRDSRVIAGIVGITQRSVSGRAPRGLPTRGNAQERAEHQRTTNSGGAPEGYVPRGDERPRKSGVFGILELEYSKLRGSCS